MEFPYQALLVHDDHAIEGSRYDSARQRMARTNAVLSSTQHHWPPHMAHVPCTSVEVEIASVTTRLGPSWSVGETGVQGLRARRIGSSRSFQLQSARTCVQGRRPCRPITSIFMAFFVASLPS